MGRKRKLENRDAIIRASYRLFIRRGYDSVSAQDIEKESGVQKRSIYRYFKSKDEILGTVIEWIEKKMLDYMQPAMTGESLATFVLFAVVKHEFALCNPDYFRMRASLIERPDTFIKNLMELYELSYPQEPGWRDDEQAMRQGLYILGGTLIVQYGFIKNISGTILSDESSDFMVNYDKDKLSDQTIKTFRRFMNYAVTNSLLIMGLTHEEADRVIEDAYERLGRLGIEGFRRYYEEALGFC